MANEIPGAVNIPLDQLRGRLDELDPSKAYITFCAIGVRAYNAARVLTERFSDVMWTFQEIVFYGIDQRVAAYLLNHAEKREDGDAVVRATHEQIAREINTAREVVARIIRRFAEDHLIETGRGAIAIKDEEGLRGITEEMLLKKV